MRRRVRCAVALLIALVGLLGLAVAGTTPAGAAVPGLPGVVAGLERSRVYIDPDAPSPHIDPARLLAVIPPGTYFASLPRTALSAAGDPAAVPALLSSQVGKGGTFIVLLEGRLFGASTTIPGRLGGELAAAQAVLPTTGDATLALTDLMRSLAGSGDLQDQAGPARAGSPVGAPLLIGMLLAALLGAAVLWWRLRRRPARRRRTRPAPPPRDLVEIDHSGRIIRRVPGNEREH